MTSLPYVARKLQDVGKQDVGKQDGQNFEQLCVNYH